MKRNRIVPILVCLFVAGLCQAEDVDSQMLGEFRRLELCAARPFHYVELDPERILELDDDDKYRVQRGDRVRIREVEVSDGGRTIDIEMTSKYTHGETAQIDLRLFKSVSDHDMERLRGDWFDNVFDTLRPFVRPCAEISAEEPVEVDSHASDVAATDVHFTADEITVVLSDGRKIVAPLAWFPELLEATYPQRADWELVHEGRVVRWLRIDAEISVDKLLCGGGG